jgi:hypothetical protein
MQANSFNTTGTRILHGIQLVDSDSDPVGCADQF